jgi:GTPase
VTTGRSERRLTATVTDLTVPRQRAFLVGSLFDHAPDHSLDELQRLTDTAGSDTVGRASLRRRRPDPATLVGSGQASRLAEQAAQLDVDVVIFDDELTPAQQRNLEKLFARDVVDRVALILDIFAQHAHSQEGMVQVELAQLRYRLPRLRGRGVELGQQGAGIGTRGPGETQLEVDRRRIQRRITKLEHDLEQLARTRATQRKARRRRALPRVALVGYTNAGKSTLLNRLTRAHVLVEDRLFSTLDPTTRRLHLPGGETILCSDTVGFVRRLPHQLVEAFRSTLEEVAEADLLVHVVDGSAPDAAGQVEAVRGVLNEIGAGDVPELLVVNKGDIADPDLIDGLLGAHADAIVVSAVTGEGVEKLVDLVGQRLRALARIVELVVPYDRGDVLAALHRDADVLVEIHADDGARVRARVPDRDLARLASFIVTD